MQTNEEKPDKRLTEALAGLWCHTLLEDGTIESQGRLVRRCEGGWLVEMISWLDGCSAHARVLSDSAIKDARRVTLYLSAEQMQDRYACYRKRVDSLPNGADGKLLLSALEKLAALPWDASAPATLRELTAQAGGPGIIDWPHTVDDLEVALRRVATTAAARGVHIELDGRDRNFQRRWRIYR